MANFDDLPIEVKIMILRTNNVGQLLKYFEINSQLKNLCQSDLLWKDLVIYKFGNVERIKDSWFETYKYLFRFSKIYILYYQFSNYENAGTVGQYGSFDKAFNSMIDYILKTRLMFTYPYNSFTNGFIKKYPQLHNLAYLNNSSSIEEVKKGLSLYLKEIEKNDHTYTIDTNKEFCICVFDIEF